MNALGDRIARLIESQGPLSIAHFMAIALHDSEAGYYATHDPFGTGGDFITAPEISQMFGELVGLWCVQLWHDQGRPSPVRLVELGPGRGALMADALRAARLAPEFLAAIDVVLIEASPTLRAIQAERLKDCGARVSWATAFDDTLADRPLLLIANEFFDALPIRQYVHTERGWCERMIMVDKDGALAFALAPVATALAVENGMDTLLGAVREISPTARVLAENVARAVAHHGGGALVIDYGYGQAGFGETLQAVGGHAFKNVLDDPGTIDLSAHVDFGSLAAAARRGGARTEGPIAQGQFLERLGIVARAAKLARLNPGQESVISSAVDRLTSPEQMGELFKVLAILPQTAPPAPGF